MALNTTGQWGSLLGWPIIAIHSTVLPDGKVLTFGTDASGAQGAMMYHDVWDPVTGIHTTLDHHMHTTTDIFCAAAAIIPGTSKILIAGGDTRGEGTGVNTGVDDVNVYDTATGQIAPASEGDLTFARWYPTVIGLPSGQILVLGGTDAWGGIVQTPEIFTPGQGWRSLTGATDRDLTVGTGTYAKAFVGGDGNVYYFGNGAGNDGRQQLFQLDTKGTGALKEVGTIPFALEGVSSSVMYDQGKVLINDSTTGLWKMDITTGVPTFEKVGALSQDRNFSTMNVLADGKVIITGGTGAGNLEAYADKTATIWDPRTNTVTETVDEAHARLYHSTAVLLTDGSILSAGGGAAGMAEKNYLDAQIYKPGYLFNADGTAATRPVVSNAPKTVEAGQVFTIDVTDAATIKDVTFVRTGSSTHNLNPETRALHLEFTQVDADTIAIKVPDNINVVNPGSWMLFAWNDKGTPSVAPIIGVKPDPSLALPADGANLLVNGDFMGNQFANTWFDTFTNNQVNGWKNASENALEVEKVAGKQTLDLDVHGAVDEIYQNVRTEAGKFYVLKFDILGATAGTSAFDLLWNGQVVKAFPDPTTGTYSLSVAGTGGMDRLSFREYAAQNDSWGAKLGNVSLVGTGEISAEYKAKSVLLNGNLLANPITSPLYDIFTNDKSVGWKNAGENGVEFYKAGTKPTLDLDVRNAADEIYQDVKTEAGRVYDLKFSILEIQAGTSAFDILWNGTVVKAFPDPKTGMVSLKVTGTGGTDRLSFREFGGQNDSIGAKLADVLLVPTAEKSDVVFGKSLIVNGDLADNQFASTWFETFGNGTIPGWKNLKDGVIEIEKVGGRQTIDVDVRGATDEIYQDVRTTAGQVYNLKLDVVALTAGSSAFDILWNGVVVKSVAGTSLESISLLVKGTGGDDRLSFREVADQNNSGGAKITNIELNETTIVDPGLNWIIGTSASEWINGTSGADHIDAGAGWDILYGDRGNDVLDGGAIAAGSGDYNQVSYDGKASDYGFARNADGTIRVSHPDYGTDTLKNIQGAFFAGEGKWYPLGELLPDIGPQTFNGTALNDRLYGTAGNDTFIGGAGEDTFTGGKGNDVYDGGAGYDQVDLLGVASDYTVTRNADGSLTVVSAREGTDTFRTIEGVYFHGDGSWLSADQFAGGAQPPPPPPVPQGQTITGTDGNEWLNGTDGNDIIDAKAGWDIVYGGRGNDILDGGTVAPGSGDYNQVSYDGKASDYTFGRAADGSITVSHPTYGNDTLKNIQGVWFAGEAKWYPLGDLAPAIGPQTFNGTALNDRMFGTAGDDTFNGGTGEDTFTGGKGNDVYDGGAGYDQVDYAGKSTEYHVSKNTDGSYTVSHATEGTDILRDIEGMYFWGDSTWYSVEDMANHTH